MKRVVGVFDFSQNFSRKVKSRLGLGQPSAETLIVEPYGCHINKIRNELNAYADLEIEDLLVLYPLRMPPEKITEIQDLLHDWHKMSRIRPTLNLVDLRGVGDDVLLGYLSDVVKVFDVVALRRVRQCSTGDLADLILGPDAETGERTSVMQRIRDLIGDGYIRAFGLPSQLDGGGGLTDCGQNRHATRRYQARIRRPYAERLAKCWYSPLPATGSRHEPAIDIKTYTNPQQLPSQKSEL